MGGERVGGERIGGDRVGDGDGLRGIGRGVDRTVGREGCGRRLNSFAIEYRRRSGLACAVS